MKICISDNPFDAKARRLCIDLVPASAVAVINPQHDKYVIHKVKSEPKDEEEDSDHEKEPDDRLNYAFKCMVCFDDGQGMTPLELHRMLSFGHCDKVCSRQIFNQF